jgi:catalase-peroxidase
MSNEQKCPFAGTHGTKAALGTRSNRDWWPNQLNLGILHQHAPPPTRWAADFDYAANSRSSTTRPLKKDLTR